MGFIILSIMFCIYASGLFFIIVYVDFLPLTLFLVVFHLLTMPYADKYDKILRKNKDE